MTNKQIEKYCGRGLPWEVRQRPVCESKDQDYIEEQAWSMKADGAFTGDLLGMIAEILVQMMQRRSNGHKLGAQDREFLSKILREDNGKEGLAGTMAKAAAPKEKLEKERQKEKSKAEKENRERERRVSGQCHDEGRRNHGNHQKLSKQHDAKTGGEGSESEDEKCS